MRIRGKLVGDFTAEDIASLVENRVGESRTLDYKRDLPGRKDADKRELLADVSSFANTAGGVLLFGIETERDANGADTGIPASICGIAAVNLDDLTRWISQVIGDGLSPSLRRVLLQAISLPAGETVLALGVPRSLEAPHAVWFEKSGKFFRRSIADKYQADVTEIRRMFSEAEEWGEEARRFHLERARLLDQGQVGLPSLPVQRTIVHALPLGRLTGKVDLGAWTNEMLMLSSPVTSSADYRHNLDGFLVKAGTPRGGGHEAHVLWLRFGGLEMFTARHHYQGNDERRFFYVEGLSKMLGPDLRMALAFLTEKVGVDPPFGIFVRIEGIQGHEISTGGYMPSWPGERLFDRHALDLPPQVVDEINEDFEAAMRPLVEVVWQSAGYTGIPQR